MEDQVINTLGVSSTILPNQEFADIQQDSLYPKMSEEDFGIMVTNRITNAKSWWNKTKLSERQDINFKYWIGDQVNKSELRDDLEKGADNAIFRNIETLIPIATSRRPELTVTPAIKNEETRDFASSVKRIDETEWETYQGMQTLVGRGIRNHQMNFIAVFQLGYDPEEDKFWTEEIYAKDLVIDRYGRFLARYIKDQTIGDLLKKFPDKKDTIIAELGLPTSELGLKNHLDSSVEYVEAWTDEVVGWKLNNIVLGVEKNPHFDYVGEEYKGEPQIDETTGAEVPTTQKVYFNYFKKPKMPFLFLTYFNRGIQVIDDTSLIEQAIGPQDWINKRKRQIGANADSMNGHWISSGDYISQEEFDKVQGGVDEKIWLENGMPSQGILHVTGTALPDFIYTDLLDSRSVVDNLMGTHSTTRGEASGNATATQDIMQKDQDFGRVDGYIRDGIETLAQKWYEYMYHMYLVYKVEETNIAIPDDDDFESDNVIFSRENVPLFFKKDGTIELVPLIFKVKQGSTLPRDEVSEVIKADKMKDSISPIDYFKKLGEANPRELTKNMLLWTEDPYSFFKDDQDVMAMLQRKAQAEQQAKAAAMAASQTGNDIISPGGDSVPQPSMTTNGNATPGGVSRAMKAMIESGQVPADKVAELLAPAA